MIIKPPIEYFIFLFITFNRNVNAPRNISCYIPILQPFYNPVENIFFHILLEEFIFLQPAFKNVLKIRELEKIMIAFFPNRRKSTNSTFWIQYFFWYSSTFLAKVRILSHGSAIRTFAYDVTIR